VHSVTTKLEMITQGEVCEAIYYISRILKLCSLRSYLFSEHTLYFR